MSTGLALFRAALAGPPPGRSALLLHATAACAAFVHQDPAAFGTDPELVRSTLAELQQVCAADAITSLYMPAAEDQAFAGLATGADADDDLAAVEALELAAHRALAPGFDITHRLLRTVGQRGVAVCGVASGPIAMALRVLGHERLAALSDDGRGEDVFDAFSAPLTTVLRRLCELGVAAVVLREDVALDTLPASSLDDAAMAYRTMTAVARHYKVPLILALDPGQGWAASAGSLAIDALSLPLAWAPALAGAPFGVHPRVPDDWLRGDEAAATEQMRALAGLGAAARVLHAEWSGAERPALERLLRIGRACGALAPRQG